MEDAPNPSRRARPLNMYANLDKNVSAFTRTSGTVVLRLPGLSRTRLIPSSNGICSTSRYDI